MTANSSSYEAPWVEKYRPEFLSDIVGNSEAVERLSAIAQVGNLPNIILAGPPGIGKTTSILCLAREMVGESYKSAVLELNASDARGIDVVRNKIKMFAQKKVTLPPGRHKIIILDEADSMTAAAQQALRRTMEIYSSTTRFALACNNSTKIIEPIQSRCAVLRYTRLADAEILARLHQIITFEKISYDPSGLEAIIFIAEGDMRNALNALQSTVSGFGKVTATNVFKVCDQPQPGKVRAMIDKLRSSSPSSSAVPSSLTTAATSTSSEGTNDNSKGGYKESMDIMLHLFHTGYAATDIIQTLFKVIKSYPMPEPEKLEYLREVGFTHMRIAEGLNSQLQLLGCLARLAQISTTKEK